MQDCGEEENIITVRDAHPPVRAAGKTSFHPHTAVWTSEFCDFSQVNPVGAFSKAILSLQMGLRTPWGMVYSALQQHSSFRPAVPSSVSPSHPQVVLSFKSLKELTRGAFPTCSPPTGLPALEGRAGRARTTTPSLKKRWQGGKEGEAGLQDNWHSTPLSHTTVQRESLIHSKLIYSVTPHSSQGCPNSSRSQNPY